MTLLESPGFSRGEDVNQGMILGFWARAPPTGRAAPDPLAEAGGAQSDRRRQYVRIGGDIAVSCRGDCLGSSGAVQAVHRGGHGATRRPLGDRGQRRHEGTESGGGDEYWPPEVGVIRSLQQQPDRTGEGGRQEYHRDDQDTHHGASCKRIHMGTILPALAVGPDTKSVLS